MLAINAQLAHCRVCGKLASRPSEGAYACPRCHTPLHFRTPRAISRSWAFTISAAIGFVPANLYPIMNVQSIDKSFTSTIMSGVIDLAQNDMLPIAIVVFVASIAVPLFKLLGIAVLLIIVQRGKPIKRQQAMRMYRFIDFIGRWSMLDLFVISILASLVSFGQLASIEANIGATAFAAVVILTLFAAESFDPRLIWDLQDLEHERTDL
ncbi:paraquat-inducible protein A [Gilvimarinus agarilyticus]|uniref:paraquat-inducible protein A n=1 Tax=unclassified Gilvimarinus TaxID=2642066 RepID=UPI001C08266C|nr:MULTISPECIES: paraquat-inducible protein A [unclassified Gilvimarinus]MBU2886475.1 paraquat-inducible protein A [Gilvimarinus agarilyticus]MDO6571154.1 paraquat-inducible protein A [Gilvimarinus sp. 2_MG-2023]MDO6748545.1 paraquat-inducible protein A [Gilvimarinus sp. 1_MG-2023]